MLRGTLAIGYTDIVLASVKHAYHKNRETKIKLIKKVKKLLIFM